MNIKLLHENIMHGVKKALLLNEGRAFDPKNEKLHKEAYNSFVKWYQRWNGKLDRSEMNALMKKVTNDVRLNNIQTINEAYGGPVDEALARDIVLTAINNSDYYNFTQQPVVKMLIRKIEKGIKLDFDHLFNSSMMTKITATAIKIYEENYGKQYISTETRKAIKQKLTQDIWDNAHDDAFA